jgi:fumarate hydratase subunit alpha
MREITAKKITETVKRLCLEANTNLSENLLSCVNKALAREKSPTGREILRQIIKNAQIAWRDKLPLCQDTGLVTVFIDVGQDVHIINGTLEEAINEGVSRAYHDGNFRKSVVSDPLMRKNSGDNTPAIIYPRLIPGETVKITVLTKGGGAENTSRLSMFRPTATKEEIEHFILETVENAGPNPCPPIIVGIGIGGTFDYAPVLAKKALLKEVTEHNSEPDVARWEKELLEKINKSGTGPMGLGGNTTALAVHILEHPCHISSLPVAVNIECHVHRHKEAEV